MLALILNESCNSDYDGPPITVMLKDFSGSLFLVAPDMITTCNLRKQRKKSLNSLISKFMTLAYSGAAPIAQHFSSMTNGYLDSL